MTVCLVVMGLSFSVVLCSDLRTKTNLSSEMNPFAISRTVCASRTMNHQNIDEQYVLLSMTAFSVGDGHAAKVGKLFFDLNS